MTFSEYGHDDAANDWSQRVHDMLDEMHQRNFVRFREAGTWQPPTDVYETHDAYFVCVDLAGIDGESADVECPNDRTLCISGTRCDPQPEGASGVLSVHVMEIERGPFRREVGLPESIRIDQVNATYSKGYLWITLPKRKTS